MVDGKGYKGYNNQAPYSSPAAEFLTYDGKLFIIFSSLLIILVLKWLLIIVSICVFHYNRIACSLNFFYLQMA